MAIRLARYKGVRVSKRWYVVLRHAEKAGVKFKLDSGRRTMAEQAKLYAHYKRFGHPVAAFPSPTAPHIRLGRADHAIDVNALDGGAEQLAKHLRFHKARVSFPVAGEPWHLEINGDDLTRLWREFR